MQYQVPQFIETEDKILGPLSLSQFILLAAAIAIGVILYSIIPVQVIGLIVAGVVIAAGAVLSLVKINGQKMTKVAAAYFNFLWKPKVYVWQPENPSLPKNPRTMQASVGQGIDLEKIMSGQALRSAWNSIQTKTTPERPAAAQPEEKFQIVSRITGEKKAARRVDYR